MLAGVWSRASMLLLTGALASCVAPLDVGDPPADAPVSADVGAEPDTAVRDAAPCECPTGTCIAGRCCERACGSACLPGRFETHVLPDHPGASWVTLADADRDGRDDLLVSRPADGALDLVWGGLVPPGATPAFGVTLALGPVASGAAITDYDDDGFADVVGLVAPRDASTSWSIRAARGTGNRGFQVLAPLDQPGSPAWITAVDADADGHDDLTLRLLDDRCVALRRRADGGYRPQRCIVPSAAEDPDDRLAGLDLDGDGRDELVELVRIDGEAVLQRHELEGGLVVRSSRLPSPRGLVPDTFDLARVGGANGALLVVFSRTATSARAAIRASDGTECELPLGEAAPGEGATLTAAGDFDGDGLLDLAGLSDCVDCVRAVQLHLGRP